MSQKKKTQNYTVDELTHELSTLVNNIANGEIPVGPDLISITNPVSFKVKQKIKDSVLSYELSFHAVLKDQKPKKTFIHNQAAKKTNAPKRSGKSSTNTPKKEAARLWKLLIQKIESAVAVSTADADSLLNVCAPSMYKDEKWHAEWIACCQKVKETIEATRKGDYSQAKELAAEVKEMTHTCHKKYK
jgi:hypothetical protein